jgi:hypothetical protein
MVKYPVFIPSKRRAQMHYAGDMLASAGIPYWVVVEPQEAEAYRGAYGAERVKVLDANDRGLHYVRNWILDYTDKMGVERHWQIDDNVASFGRGWGQGRRKVEAAEAMSALERFVDGYRNIALGGYLLWNWAFGEKYPEALWWNKSAASVHLIKNGLGFRYRPHCFEDTDMALQVLVSGWCTVTLTRYLIRKERMGKMPGGSDYQYRDNGKSRLHAGVARLWPGLVKANQPFRNWRRFQQRPISKEAEHGE